MSMSIEAEEPTLPKPFIKLEADYDLYKGEKWGVLLKVKSKPWEDLFKKLSGEKLTFKKNNGVEGDFYEFPYQGEKLFRDLALPSTPRELMHYDGGGGEPIVSLYYLRTPGLSTGIEVFYPGIFEGETIKKYAIKVGERAERLYKKLSPGSVKMKMWIGDYCPNE